MQVAAQSHDISLEFRARPVTAYIRRLIVSSMSIGRSLCIVMLSMLDTCCPMLQCCLILVVCFTNVDIVPSMHHIAGLWGATISKLGISTIVPGIVLKPLYRFDIYQICYLYFGFIATITILLSTEQNLVFLSGHSLTVAVPMVLLPLHFVSMLFVLSSQCLCDCYQQHFMQVQADVCHCLWTQPFQHSAPHCAAPFVMGSAMSSKVVTAKGVSPLPSSLPTFSIACLHLPFNPAKEFVEHCKLPQLGLGCHVL